MKRIIKDGSSSKESKIISTQDIYLGTDINESLDDHLKKQDDEIYNLKKWTKWYVKYGGMGSGGGGGSSDASGSFGYKIYIRDNDNTVQEVTGSELNLWGTGYYTFIINVLKSKGHPFSISYWTNNGNVTTKLFGSGSTTYEVRLNLREKTLFGFYLTDRETEESSEQVLITVIPESYNITPSLVYNSGASLSNTAGQSITLNALKENIYASFKYSIYRNIEVFWKIRYKLEDEETWTEITETTDEFGNTIDNRFRYSESGDTVTGEVKHKFSFNYTEEYSIGKKIYIDLIYGQTIDSTEATSLGKYELTIIPEGSYILLTDQDNCLYLNKPEDTSNMNKISKGYLPFIVKLCNGLNSFSGQVTIDLYDKDDNYIRGISRVLKANQNNSISNIYGLNVTESGLYKIRAYLTSSSSVETIKYFYVKETDINWSFDSFLGDNYIRVLYDDSSTNPFLGNNITLYNSSYEKLFNNKLKDFNSNKFNYNIALGIQYDSSNDNSFSILKLETSIHNSLEVYQNDILYNGSSVLGGSVFYFPKTKNSDETDANLWHLLNININYIRTDDNGTASYYEISIYIDGILENVGRISGFTAINGDFLFNKITINPEKSNIIKLNLFDITIKPVEGFSRDSRYEYIYDSFASEYYYKYLSDLGRDKEVIDNKDLTNLLKGFKFNKFGIPYIPSKDFLNFALAERILENGENDKILKLPILVLNIDVDKIPDAFDDNSENISDYFFYNWFISPWAQTPSDASQIPEKLDGTLYYVSSNRKKDSQSNLLLDDLLIKDERQNSIGFSFEIQGSSTKSFGIKNIELSINQVGNTERVFTPNFDLSDTNSFLPEKSFTLKADMVDSSTCNNNAIGDFVNKNTKPLDAENCSERKTDLGGHVKNCLTGFPVLIFIQPTRGSNTDANFYFIGIYNFNLGRNSYYNLGYYKKFPDEFSSLVDNIDPGEFKYIEIDTQEEIHEDLTITEISNNINYFDFSQYHSSVLLPSEAKHDAYSMFSYKDSLFRDFTASKRKLTDAVKSISRAGGYIFDRLRKNKIPIKKNYPESPYCEHFNGVSCNYVSDYRTQYTRTANEGDYTEIESLEDEATILDLLRCIGLSLPEDEIFVPNNNIRLDLRSTVEYYVICMVFGMVDSVMKNMELKSWNKSTLFPAFYDMDTALGVDNSGGPVSFFSFSDFWKNSEEYDDRTNSIKSNGVEIYPDHDQTNTGYDVPSSYLFAIAKYATMDLVIEDYSKYLPQIDAREAGLNDPAPISPVNIYTLYRRVGGELETANKFIENYFSNRLKNIPQSIKNLNYRVKYAKVSYWGINDYNSQIANHDGNDTLHVSNLTDITKYNGSGTHRKEDWLKSRLRLLDSYFNISSSSDARYRVRSATLSTNENGDIIDVTWSDILEKNSDGSNKFYYYPTITNIGRVNFSDESSISKQFIVNQNTKSNIHATPFIVKAPSYTPIIFTKEGASPEIYLIGDDAGNNSYQFNFSTAGNLKWSILGSTEFSYVNNIGLLRLSFAEIKSDNLKNISYINSENVGGQTSDYIISSPNIETVVINSNKYSGTLTFSDEYNFNRLTSIDLKNSLVSVECGKNLQINNLDISGMSCNQIVFRNSTKLTKVDFSGSTIGTLELPIWNSNISITGDNNASYTYKNVSITSFTLDGNDNFNDTEVTLTINKINSLKSVNALSVTNLTIRDCPNLEKVYIGSSLKSITITNCSTNTNVEYLSISNSDFSDGVLNFSHCYGNENIVLNFNGTRKFHTVNIGNNVAKLGGNAFRGCSELMYLDNDNEGCYLINGTNIFYSDSKLTLKSSNSNESNPLYPTFKTSTDNLTGTFSCEESGISGSIEFDAADHFLTSLVDTGTANTVTNITKLFYDNPRIGNDWNFNKKFTSLSEFKHITDASFAFGYCNINRWSKELFNFGSESEEIEISYGVFYCPSSKDVFARTNFLENIGSKLKTYIDRGEEGAEQYITFVDGNNSDTTLSTVQLSDVLQYLTKVKTLNAFAYIKNNKVDFKNAFSNCSKIEIISRVCFRGKNWINLVYNDDVSGQKTSCFQGLTKLTTVSTSFGEKSNITTIDLFYLFSADQWKNINIFPYTSGGTVYLDAFSENKEITSENFETLLGYLFNNTGQTRISLLNTFRNCKITNCSSTPKIKVNSLLSGNIVSLKTLYGVFRDLKAYDGQNNEIPIIIDSDFFKYLRNLTRCDYLFSGMWIKNYIHFDFFKRRQEINTSGYYPDRDYHTLTEVSGKNYTYFLSTSPKEGNFIFTDDETENLGGIDFNSRRTTYIKDSTTLSKKYLLRFETDRYREGSSTVTPTDDDTGETTELTTTYTIYRYSNPEVIEEFIESREVDVRYFTYTDRNINNISYIFYNCKFYIPYFRYPGCDSNFDNILTDEEYKSNFINNNRSYIIDKQNSTEYEYYYTDRDCTTKDLYYRRSVEIDDLKDITCDFTTQVTYTSSKGTISLNNFKLGRELYGENDAFPIIPSDFFYGLNSNCDIKYAFGTSDDQDIKDVTDEGYLRTDNRKYILEGYLPKHLFSQSTITSFSNFLWNLNVIPVKYGNSNYYSFVPENFITNTLSNIKNLFNFHIRVPSWRESSNETNHVFYVMYINSIKTSGSVTFDNTFPRKALVGYGASEHGNRGLINTKDQLPIDVTLSKCNFNYSLLLAPPDENNLTPRAGYIDSVFKGGFLLEDAISSHLLYVLSGRIFSDEYTINSIDNSNYTKPPINGIIYGSDGQRGINRFFKFPKANQTFASIFGTSNSNKTIPRRIHIDSIRSSDSGFWEDSFPGISIKTE